MKKTRADHDLSRLSRLRASVVDHQLREALAARAERLGLDPVLIFSPTPGADRPRHRRDALLRVDFRTYQAPELER